MLCPLSVSVRGEDQTDRQPARTEVQDMSTSTALQKLKEMSTCCVLQALRPALRGAIRVVEVIPDAHWWDASASPDDRVVVDSYEAAARVCSDEDKATVVLINVAHASCDWHAIQTLKRNPAVARVVAYAAAKAGAVTWLDRFVANCVSLCGPTEKRRSDTARGNDTASGARNIDTDGEPFAAVHATMGFGSGSHCLAMLLSTEACSEVSPLASHVGRPYCFKCGSIGPGKDTKCNECDTVKALFDAKQTIEATATATTPPLNTETGRKYQQVESRVGPIRRTSRRLLLLGFVLVGCFAVFRKLGSGN